MFYCFVDVDLKALDKRNPLFLQFEYAKLLNKCLILQLVNERLVSWDGNEVEIFSEKIFLRTTCTNIIKALRVLDFLGLDVLETSQDIEKIENWFQYGLTRRNIFSLDCSKIFNQDIEKEYLEEIKKYDNCFIKTQRKGICLRVSSKKILSYDYELIQFLKKHVNEERKKLLITEFLNIKKDSLGNRETRFFIINNTIISFSRTLHSLKHMIMPSHLEKAKLIVGQLSNIEDFPKNYVLDLGEFMDGEDTYIDIVEINPISVAMCYVNNTIFFECHEVILAAYNNLNMGYEYCFDSLENLDYYHVKRQYNANYQYGKEDYYCIV